MKHLLFTCLLCLNYFFSLAQNGLLDNDLQEAIDNSNYTKVEQLIKQGVNINNPNVNGFTPLALAVTKQDIKISKLLLDNGADINYVNKYGNSILTNTLFTKNVALITFLLDNGADPNYVSKYNMSILMSIVTNLRVDIDGFLPIFKLVLEHPKTNIDTPVNIYGSVLHFAVLMGQVESVELLLKYNAKTNSFNNQGLTPLTLAIQSRKLDIVQVFVTQKKGLKDKTQKGETPLEFIQNGFKTQAIIEILQGTKTIDKSNSITVDYIVKKIRYGISPNKILPLFDKCENIKTVDSKYKNNLLYYTVSYPQLFEELLKRGVNPNEKINTSGTILHHIAGGNFDSEKLLPLLKKYHADFSLRDNEGNIPLHYAAKSDKFSNCILFVKYGDKTHISVKNKEGKTPYDIATEEERLNHQYYLKNPTHFQEDKIWQVKNMFLISNQRSTFFEEQQDTIQKLKKITSPSTEEVLALKLAYHNTGNFLAAKTLLERYSKDSIVKLHLVEILLDMGMLYEAKEKFISLTASQFKDEHLIFFHYVDAFMALEFNKFQIAINKGNKALSFVKQEDIFRNKVTVAQQQLLFKINEKIGIAYLNLEDFENANICFLKSANYTNQETNPIFFGRFHHNQARLYLHFNNLYQPYQVIKRAISIYQKYITSTHPFYLESLSIIADYFLLAKEYAAAELLYNHISQIYAQKQGKNSIKYISTIYKKTILYEHLGNLDKSIELLKNNHKIAQKQGLTEYPFFIDNSLKLADYYRSINDFEQSFTLTKNAQELTLKLYGKSNDRYYKTLHNLALIHIFRKEYKEAEKKLLTIQKTNKNVYSNLNNDYLMLHLGVLYQVQKQYTNAINAYLLVANSKVGPYYNPLFVTKAYTNLSKIYIQQKKYSAAQTRLLELEEEETERIDKSFPILSEKEKELLYKQTLQGFNLLNSLLVFHHENNDLLKKRIYNHQLNYKALLLHQSIKIKNKILNSGNQRLISKYSKWQQNKNILSRSKNMQVLSEVEKLQLKNLENETELLEKEISFISHDFKSQNSKKVTWLDIQRKLKPQEVAIEIIRSSFEDSVYYYALIITPTSKAPEFVPIENGKNLETTDFKFYQNCIQYKIEDGTTYERYFKNIHQKLPSKIKTIYFSPDGIYNKLNLNTIFIPEKQKYLLDIFEIQPLTNTKELVDTALRSNPQQPVLFGRPLYDGEPSEKSEQRSLNGHTNLHTIFEESDFSDLPGTEKEINAIKDVLTKTSSKFSIFMGKEATEHNLKQVSNPSILHLATHGFFFSDTEKKKAYDENTRSFDLLHELLEDLNQQVKGSNPMTRSGIILTGATTYLQKSDTNSYKEDGIFTAFEALNLSLDHTKLVVLSACETGLGDIVNGEGVYGLQRALKIAGAQNILMSLWKVDDEATQKLMKYFYTNLLTTKNKRSAFIQAQQQLKKEYPEPYFWGAFILIGK